LEVRACEWRRFGLGMTYLVTLIGGRRTGPATGILALQLFLDFVQRIPARIADMLLTMTLLDIQIAAAQRTQTFAIFAA